MELEPELEPCPFCGGEAEIEEVCGSNYRIYCTECPAEMNDFYDSKEESLKVWNRRASPPNNPLNQKDHTTIARNGGRSMKKFVKVVLTILRYGWYGALTIFSGLVFLLILLTIMDKVFKNSIIVGAVGCVLLIFATIGLGNEIDDHIEKRK